MNLSINPATLYECRNSWVPSLEAYADGAAIDTLTDRAVRALGKTLTGTGAARPTMRSGANGRNGLGVAELTAPTTSWPLPSLPTGSSSMTVTIAGG